MAEKRKTQATKPKRKTAKPSPAKKPATPPKKPPRKMTAAKAGKAAARPASSKKANTFNIADLIDHPLVADLLAVGAMAAVAAIADHNVKTRTGEAKAGSSKAVKAAGKAAASAIGKRLITELEAVKQASKAKAERRKSG